MAITLTWPLTSDGAGAVTYTANDWRTLLTNLYTEGVLGSGSFLVSERAAGANMQLDIAAGVAVLEGDDAAGQGRYLVEATASLEGVTLASADPSNPRIDLVGIQLNDPSEGGSAGRNSVFAAVTGTPAASPSAPATPDSFLLLASVTVPAGAASISDSNITDARVLANLVHQAQIGATTATADTLVRRSDTGHFNVPTPGSTNHAANKQYVDGLFVAAGGTVSSINYRKLGNMVFVWGIADGGETIPSGYRPTSTTVAPAFGTEAPSGAGTVQVATTGAVSANVGGAQFSMHYLTA